MTVYQCFEVVAVCLYRYTARLHFVPAASDQSAVSDLSQTEYRTRVFFRCTRPQHPTPTLPPLFSCSRRHKLEVGRSEAGTVKKWLQTGGRTVAETDRAVKG